MPSLGLNDQICHVGNRINGAFFEISSALDSSIDRPDSVSWRPPSSGHAILADTHSGLSLIK